MTDKEQELVAMIRAAYSSAETIHKLNDYDILEQLNNSAYNEIVNLYNAGWRKQPIPYKHTEETNKFLQLVKENPGLRIIPLVCTEVVADESYSNWCGSFGACYIDEICEPENAERVYFKSNIDELKDFLNDQHYEEENMSSRAYDKMIDDLAEKQDWEK